MWLLVLLVNSNRGHDLRLKNENGNERELRKELNQGIVPALRTTRLYKMVQLLKCEARY